MKVVMVDDDRIVRQYIRTVLERTQGEFVLAGEAANGSKGLQLIMEIRPELLILDMEMPSMGGIELLHELEARQISVRVLILSCHDEFEYVRQAMKLGAADYLLKHKVDDETLLTALRTLRDTAAKQHNLPVSLEDEKQQELGRLLAGFGDEKKSDEQSGIFVRPDQAAVVCAVEVDYLRALIRSKGEKEAERTEKKVWETIITTTAAGCEGYPYRADAGYYGLLLVFAQLPVSGLEIRRKLNHSIMTYMTEVERVCEVTVTIGVSEYLYGAKQLHEQWLHARQAMTHKFYLGCGRLIHFSEIPEVREDRSSEQQLLEKISGELAKREDILVIVQEIFDGIKKSPLSFKQFQSLLYSFFNSLMRLISHMNLEIGEIFSNVDFVSEAFETLETLDGYRDWFRDVVESVFDVAGSKARMKLRREIIQAQEYIEQHYMEEIVLEDVAKYVCVSKTYFSSMFKKETGQKFSQYLIDYRLEKACELLRQSDRKIYDIAYDVGFLSHNYFNNIFKERRDMTPREYRMQFQKNILEADNN